MANFRKPRILVMRNAGLGDVIMATPIVRKIYNDRKGLCNIAVRTYYPEVFQNSPYVNEIYGRNDSLPVNDFDLILCLDKATDRENSRYIIDAYAFYAFGHGVIDCECELFSTKDDREIAEKLSSQFQSGFITIHMKTGLPASKTLPAAFWCELIDGLLKSTDLGIVQVGTGSDLAFNNGSPRIVDLRGQASLHQLREVMGSSRCFVGVDSGPFHIARTTATNMVVFFTIMRSENLFRRHFRNGLFKALTPSIDCYGCLELGGDYNTCPRGDMVCVDRFDLSEALTSISRFSTGESIK